METLTTEQEIDFIAGRIIDEYRKHPTLEWHKIAASKIHSQWKEYWQKELEADKWISVKDRLPERHTEVLIFRNGKEIESVIYGFHNGRGYTDFTETDFCKVTHWQPLPDKPKDK